MISDNLGEFLNERKRHFCSKTIPSLQRLVGTPRRPKRLKDFSCSLKQGPEGFSVFQTNFPFSSLHKSSLDPQGEKGSYTLVGTSRGKYCFNECGSTHGGAGVNGTYLYARSWKGIHRSPGWRRMTAATPGREGPHGTECERKILWNIDQPSVCAAVEQRLWQWAYALENWRVLQPVSVYGQRSTMRADARVGGTALMV